MDLRRLLQRWRGQAPASSANPAPLAKRVRTAFRLDAAGWNQLSAEVRSAVTFWSDETWLSLPARDRAALHHAAAGDRASVEALAESRTVHGPSFLIDRATHQIDLGLDLDLPTWLMEAQDQDLVARLTVEAAGASPMVVAGTSFISGLTFDPSLDSVRVEAGSSAVEVMMRPDAAADAESGERWADQTAASWWARVDVDRTEPTELTVTIRSAGVVRQVSVTVPAYEGEIHGVAAEGRGATLELTSDAPRLSVGSSTEGWAAGPSPLVLDSHQERFGVAAAVPTGRYAVTAESGLDLASPESLALPLADRAISLGDVLVTLRAWSPGESAVSVGVRNPIPVEQRGRRRQRLLLDEVREHAGPLQERAVAMCFGGSGAGDSVAPIALELVRRGIPVDWCVADHSVSVPSGVRPVLLHSREWHEAFTHARYLVNNAEFPHYVRFREGQRYLQTWHGTPLKRIGRDIASPRLSAGYTAAMARESAVWEALLAQNGFAAEVFPGAFGFTGRVIVEGYPRNDALATDAEGPLRRATRAALGLGDEIAVLYAPTWRDTARSHGGRRAFVSHLDAGQVHERTGATVLMRSHSNAAAARGRLSGPGVVDVTAHPDITALLAAADVLVTDYSSVMFDFAVTGRPQILLVPDAAEYLDERGFYLDLRETPPGPIVTSTDGVVEVLLGEDTMTVEREAFRQRFAPLDDGGSAARVVDDWLGANSVTQQA